MTTFRLIVLSLLVLAMPALGWAGTTNAITSPASPPSGALNPAKPLAERPDKPVDRRTLISVQLEGTDSIGANLGMRLKERFNQSNLFTLNNDEERTAPFAIVVTTKPEFPGRPGAGSVYSVTWLFVQGKGYLGLILGKDLGTLTNDEIPGLVDQLLERTDGIAARYASFWKN